MRQRLTHIKVKQASAPGWVGEVLRVFRRIGGLSRLDVAFSLLSIGCVAVWNCLLDGKRQAVKASFRPAVYLLTYIPADKNRETA